MVFIINLSLFIILNIESESKLYLKIVAKNRKNPASKNKPRNIAAGIQRGESTQSQDQVM
jgi:hypothetical protein